tara:strand:+ start:654 stop:1154 length:501 start_codon:yes stop_codon:yes gene_type:complete
MRSISRFWNLVKGAVTGQQNAVPSGDTIEYNNHKTDYKNVIENNEKTVTNPENVVIQQVPHNENTLQDVEKQSMETNVVHSIPLHAVTLKPHIPLIKFRKKQSNEKKSSSELIGLTKKKALDKEILPVVKGVSLEWWQIPGKYKKRPIDEAECEHINMGGSDILWK